MRINFNPQSNCGNNQHFGIRLVENDSLIRYIDSLHFRNQKNNLKQAVTIIRNQIERNPDNKNLIIGALHPSKANYVKNGTYDEFFITPQKRVKQTSDRFERENIYMQFDGTDKIQGFYMNPDENPKNLASWFMNTFNYYKSKIAKKP